MHHNFTTNNWPQHDALYFGSKPSQSKTQKENEKLNNQLLKYQIDQMKKGTEEAAMPSYEAPEPPIYAPPPTSTPADAEAQASEYMRAMKRRRGFTKSRLAGETGGASKAPSPSGATQGSKSKLG